MSLRELTDENFAKVIEESEIPVVVDFWASWCGPCKKISPVMEQLAEELTGKVEIVKVNVDEAINTGLKEKILGLPTVAVFKNGKRVIEFTGVAPKDAIRKIIESQL